MTIPPIFLLLLGIAITMPPKDVCPKPTSIPKTTNLFPLTAKPNAPPLATVNTRTTRQSPHSQQTAETEQIVQIDEIDKNIIFTPVQHNTNMFVEVAKLAHVTDYAHIKIQINFTEVRENIELGCVCRNRAAKSKNDHYRVRHEIQKLRGLERNTESSCEDIFNRLNGLETLFKWHSRSDLLDQINRFPRHIAIMPAIKIVASTMVPFATWAILDLLQGPSKSEIILEVKKHSTVTHTQPKSMKNLTTISDRLDFVLDTANQRPELITEVYYECENALAVASAQMEHVESATTTILNGHIPFSFIKADHIQGLLSTLQDNIKDHGFETEIETPQDLHGLPTSHIATDDKLLHVVIHVPIFRPPLYDLKKYAPIPHVWQNDRENKFMQIIESREPFLALKPDRTSYITFTNLEKCKVYGTTYYCDHPVTPIRASTRNCLYAIYSGNIPVITELCDIINTPKVETVTKIADNFFYHYTPQHATVTITCSDTGLNPSITINGPYTVQVPGGCTISSANYTYSSAGARLDIGKIILDNPSPMNRRTITSAAEKHNKTIDTFAANRPALLDQISKFNEEEPFLFVSPTVKYISIGLAIINIIVLGTLGYGKAKDTQMYANTVNRFRNKPDKVEESLKPIEHETTQNAQVDDSSVPTQHVPTPITAEIIVPTRHTPTQTTINNTSGSSTNTGRNRQLAASNSRLNESDMFRNRTDA